MNWLDTVYQFSDQIFVNFGNWILILAQSNSCCQNLLLFILKIIPIVTVFPLIFALTTWAERKLLGRIQNRIGPNRVGPAGLLQPIADGLKILTKEDIVPARADHFVHTLAPILTVIPAFLVIAVLPIGRNMTPVDLNIG